MFTVDELSFTLYGHFVTFKDTDGQRVYVAGPNAVLPAEIRSRLVTAVIPDPEPAGVEGITAVIVIVEA